jgi:predicted Mrr-cat superfamily restriction endonuclease
MKILQIAATIASFGIGAALAQSPEVAKHNCEPKPAYPGVKAMKSDVEVKAFEAQMKNYKECIVAYISARKTSAKAHEAAENLAAREYNETMAKIRADQEASIKETDASRKQDAKDTVSSPKAPGSKTY